MSSRTFHTSGRFLLPISPALPPSSQESRIGLLPGWVPRGGPEHLFPKRPTPVQSPDKGKKVTSGSSPRTLPSTQKQGPSQGFSEQMSTLLNK